MEVGQDQRGQMEVEGGRRARVVGKTLKEGMNYLTFGLRVKRAAQSGLCSETGGAKMEARIGAARGGEGGGKV